MPRRSRAGDKCPQRKITYSCFSLSPRVAVNHLSFHKESILNPTSFSFRLATYPPRFTELIRHTTQKYDLVLDET